jgi:hypothetical protein
VSDDHGDVVEDFPFRCSKADCAAEWLCQIPPHNFGLGTAYFMPAAKIDTLRKKFGLERPFLGHMVCDWFHLPAQSGAWQPRQLSEKKTQP